MLHKFGTIGPLQCSWLLVFIFCKSITFRGLKTSIAVAVTMQPHVSPRHVSPLDDSRAHGPLTRYVKLQVAHAPGMPGTFSPAADFKGYRKLAIPACITARAWRTCRDACRDRLPAVTGKTFPAFPAHAHPQFCVSGKRPMNYIQVHIVDEFWSITYHYPLLTEGLLIFPPVSFWFI